MPRREPPTGGKTVLKTEKTHWVERGLASQQALRKPPAALAGADSDLLAAPTADPVCSCTYPALIDACLPSVCTTRTANSEAQLSEPISFLSPGDPHTNAALEDYGYVSGFVSKFVFLDFDS